jgi:hypothetical protein
MLPTSKPQMAVRTERQRRGVVAHTSEKMWEVAWRAGRNSMPPMRSRIWGGVVCNGRGGWGWGVITQGG